MRRALTASLRTLSSNDALRSQTDFDVGVDVAGDNLRVVRADSDSAGRPVPRRAHERGNDYPKARGAGTQQADFGAIRQLYVDVA